MIRDRPSPTVKVMESSVSLILVMDATVVDVTELPFVEAFIHEDFSVLDCL